MQSAALKINHLLEYLEDDDYDKVISYIEFLVSNRRKEKIQRKKTENDREDVEGIITSLIGAIPDEGKTLEQYRNERLKKYENPY